MSSSSDIPGMSSSAPVDDPSVERPPAPMQIPCEPASASDGGSQRGKALAIVLFLVIWAYLYNISLKGLGFVASFFHVLDTISDDFLMGSLLAVGIGISIVVVFSGMKLYGQIVANVASFRILEEMVYTDLREGRFKTFAVKLMNFRDLPRPEQNCPERVPFILLSFCFIYLMSWIYVILFSEALFFASWSAGVNLPINEHNVVLMPTLALSIPFASRVMAYFRYPYAQDFADLLPAAAFVLLLVTMLGVLFESHDQKFYLLQVFDDKKLAIPLLTNGVFLAFIPVFSEALFWLIELLAPASADESETPK